MLAAGIQNVVTDVLHGVVYGMQSNMGGDPRITQLAQTVSSQMTQAEEATYRALDPSVCTLYLHFMLSLLGVIECALRLVFILLFLFTWFVIYYLIQCFSCGKNQDISMSTPYYLTAFWMYIGILCGLLGNLVVPWSPGLYFYSRGVAFLRPLEASNQHVYRLPRHVGVCDVCCGCGVCCGIADSRLPIYKLLQSSLLVAGGFSQLFLSSCCGENFPTMCSHARDTQLLQDQIELERTTATVAFYQQHYQCGSFDELCQREIGVLFPSSGGGSGSGGGGGSNTYGGNSGYPGGISGYPGGNVGYMNPAGVTITQPPPMAQVYVPPGGSPSTNNNMNPQYMYPGVASGAPQGGLNTVVRGTYVGNNNNQNHVTTNVVVGVPL